MLIDSSQIKDVKIPGMNDGTGKAVCNGQEEILNAGTCHICKKEFNFNNKLICFEHNTFLKFFRFS